MEKVFQLFENCYDSFFKPLLYAAWIAVFSVFSPITYVFYALFAVWLFNFLIGLGADVHAHGKQFSLAKAFDSVKQIVFFGLAAVVIYLVPKLVGDVEIGVKGVNALIYIVSYYYLTNIFRNAKEIWPQKAEIAFIYELLSTQIFTKLKTFLGIKQNGKN
jgi:hypothetical protein